MRDVDEAPLARRATAVDVDLVHEMLFGFGPVYYRLLLSGGTLDKGLATRIVDALLPAIRSAPSA